MMESFLPLCGRRKKGLGLSRGQNFSHQCLEHTHHPIFDGITQNCCHCFMSSSLSPSSFGVRANLSCHQTICRFNFQLLHNSTPSGDFSLYLSIYLRISLMLLMKHFKLSSSSIRTSQMSHKLNIVGLNPSCRMGQYVFPR